MSTWRVEKAGEFDDAGAAANFPNGVLRCLSPCFQPVSVEYGGLDHALCVLQNAGLTDAVRAALQGIRNGWVPPEAHADFCVAYDEQPMLMWVLQDSIEACEYVLALPRAPLPYLRQRIERAKHLARVMLAQHGAYEAIGVIERAQPSQ